MQAGVAELADARDSNSRVLTDLWVRFPPPAQQDIKTAPNLSVEQFLSLVSFDSTKKPDELELEANIESEISYLYRLESHKG